MGRWRPPAKAASPYITPAGYEALKTELDESWLRRRDVVKALSEAAAEGDRSENAEYIYRKKELAGIDRRIRYLQKRLPILKVVREHPRVDAVYFGATIEVCDETGTTSVYRIVGPDETDAKSSAISIDSPVAKALLGKRVDDEVTVQTADKTRTVAVLSIRYCIGLLMPSSLLPALLMLASLLLALPGMPMLMAQEAYSYDETGDRRHMTNTAILERWSPAAGNNRSLKLVTTRALANAAFTSEAISVDGEREAAWDHAPAYEIAQTYNHEMTAPAPGASTAGSLRFLWDGPVLYVLVEVIGDQSPAANGTPDWNQGSFSPDSDGIFVFMDVFNDQWGMETDTQGVFFLGANPELDAVSSYNNAFIPSLGSFFNPDNQDHSPRLKAFASSGYIAGDSNVSYRYELGLQIEGWGDAWDRQLGNGSEIGIEIAVHDQGNSYSWWSRTDVNAGREGNSNLPNSERARNRDWGVVTLTGWNGETLFAFSDWSAREAIRFWNSRSNPGGSGNGTAPEDSGDGSLVWTPTSKARMVAAKNAFLALAADASREQQQAAVLEVNEAFAGLRWADTRYPDPADLPVQMTLPNLWEFFDDARGTAGAVTNRVEWEQRRNELLELAQFYEYGYKPQRGLDYTLQLLEVSLNTTAGNTNSSSEPGAAANTASQPSATASTRVLVRVRVTPTNTRYSGGEAREFDISLALPDATTQDRVGQPAPIGFGGNWTDIGIASMRFPNWAFDVRTHDGAWGNPNRTGLFYEIFPYQRNSTEADSSILIANAAAVSIHLDALEMAVAANAALADRIDPGKAVTRGFSIGGKNAFVAAVFDERVKVVVNGGSGATGPANWRYNAQGQEYDFTDTPFYNPGAGHVIAHGTEGPGNSYRHNRVRETELFRHFMPYGHMYSHETGAYNYGGYSRLPFDQALLLATLAPERAILINTNMNDFNNGALTDNMSLQIARSAWRVLGADADDFVKFNNGNYVSNGDPHGFASDEPERLFLSDFFFGTNELAGEEADRLITDPFALPVSNGQTQSPYDYYWGGFNTITGGSDGIEGTDGWYYYQFPESG